MIPVSQLYYLTYQDIASEERRGYSSPDEINRAIDLAQDVLFNYYLDRGDTRPLRPFTAAARIKTRDGRVTMPKDLRYLQLLYLEGPLTYRDGETRRRTIPYTIVDQGQWQRLQDDLILRGDLENGAAWATPSQGGYRLSPAPGGDVYVDYYRNPVSADLRLVYDPQALTAQVDEANSNSLEWDSRHVPHLVNLILAGLGISVRSSELIEFAQAQGVSVGTNLTP